MVGSAWLFGVKLKRRHALPIMTVMAAGLTLVVLIESDQLPLSTMSLGEMIHILWKPALINAGAILGVYTAGTCIKDY